MAQGFSLAGELNQTGVLPTRPQDEVVRGAGPGWFYRTAEAAQENADAFLEGKAVDHVTRRVDEKR